MGNVFLSGWGVREELEVKGDADLLSKLLLLLLYNIYRTYYEV